jgi:hypothetical protein
MCSSHVTGEQIANMSSFCTNGNRNWNALGLPGGSTLAEMVNRATRLPLTGRLGKGLYIHVARYAVGREGWAVQTKRNEFVRKSTARSCWEDRILPLAIDDGHILVHQSVAPCRRCRGGYRTWAKSRMCTIIVYGDKGYDQCEDDSVFICEDDSVFIFSSTELVYFGKL